ncbi:alpha-(1,3)-fucosyltransferase 10 isoform X1 [Mus musculus]|uniref:GDP-fucose protein O-fucosyltransferase 3 n=2 Tax=Mus musculus TaxID=10090 RepID=OFUT3_MOUSE|nr:alpha-(1,3)-fucosyltransferase 10 isoform a [Mus musculus]NP_001273351.1 alpha-(1,3)-fucosyltransferase 10 isoform a [Mus musculus]XP_030099189.1 alpha-(1,3)-fucosyltransferase 10 isoform X1 [Mus musculus]Q5F2L2.1 RecName: Full=Alpha-(1,3)-fucosyltransferase 10; AltName: Full=Fucosyltransferase X; Short=Fuc-TX; Short=FucT-X; AltName: Full=Galactoside 3-L-fucosyltransferase 10; Short=Fucosyltransferase 10 [Mus musculus]CAI53944.1 alpha3-fucosyltransferase [Mus musculus]BAE27706.1 unnamed pro|eukprot:NP_001012535.1 alpha-(1,3)-fucosyltransferase 10 isoform a [Mus musculus]
MVRFQRRKLLASCLCVTATVFLMVTLQVVVELGKFERKKLKDSNVQDGHRDVEGEPKHLEPFPEKEALALAGRTKVDAGSYPIVLWWSPLTGETGRLGQCGADACFFTINRTFQHHPMTRAFLFYGTDFNIDSLPLPREAHHDWALFHEESPKNNYKLFHKPVITLFNHTATFSRHSHLPLTTQYLEGVDVLKSLRYLVPLQAKNNLRQKLAPLVYVQSDCDPPSDRDSYVRELMAYIEVDSYGECLQNRDLPQQLKNPASMDADAFYRVIAQYKFILAFENAVCDDYITEKFWRPLKLGVVPVYYGSPTIADWLPSNRSAILVSEFSHPRELASFIRRLDYDDGLYETYVEWKLKGKISNQRLLTALNEREWGVQDINQDNYIDSFECMVCRRVWANSRLQEQGLPPKQWKADVSHLHCPEPALFTFSSPASPALRGRSLRELWLPSFQQSKKEAQALRWLVDRNQNFSSEEFWALVFKD